MTAPPLFESLVAVFESSVAQRPAEAGGPAVPADARPLDFATLLAEFVLPCDESSVASEGEAETPQQNVPNDQATPFVSWVTGMEYSLRADVEPPALASGCDETAGQGIRHQVESSISPLSDLPEAVRDRISVEVPSTPREGAGENLELESVGPDAKPAIAEVPGSCPASVAVSGDVRADGGAAALQFEAEQPANGPEMPPLPPNLPQEPRSGADLPQRTGEMSRETAPSATVPAAQSGTPVTKTDPQHVPPAFQAILRMRDTAAASSLHGTADARPTPAAAREHLASRQASGAMPTPIEGATTVAERCDAPETSIDSPASQRNRRARQQVADRPADGIAVPPLAILASPEPAPEKRDGKLSSSTDTASDDSSPPVAPTDTRAVTKAADAGGDETRLPYRAHSGAEKAGDIRALPVPTEPADIPPELAAESNSRGTIAGSGRGSWRAHPAGIFRARLVPATGKVTETAIQPELRSQRPTSATKAGGDSAAEGPARKTGDLGRPPSRASDQDVQVERQATATRVETPVSRDGGSNVAMTLSPLAASETLPPGRPAPPAPESAPPAASTLPQAPESQRTGAPVKDIHFEVSAGQQQVAVRLTERRGEVHVAVRTPDARLAGELRDNLPALSARLEQSGFRAENWSPQIAPAEKMARTAEPAQSGSPDHSAGQRQGSGGKDQPEPRRPKPEVEQSTTKGKRKESSWFASNLQ